jgi:hypothetical protein
MGFMNKKISDVTVREAALLYQGWHLLGSLKTLVEDAFEWNRVRKHNKEVQAFNEEQQAYNDQYNAWVDEENAKIIQRNQAEYEEWGRVTKGCYFALTQENIDRLKNLCIDKQFGYTPEGGWDQYKWLSPWIVRINVQRRNMNRTGNWPSWLTKRPANPTNWEGEPWTTADETIDEPEAV